MTDEVIPADIKNFIARHIDSVIQLEALLLLRACPDETWTLSAMAKRLYVTEQEVAEVLVLLCHDGLLSVNERVYRYSRLSTLYSRQLIPVTNVIHAKPRRIRQFADAFRFRKDR
jgi:hypothetical protein